MRIIELRSENIKRLKAISIRPAGNMVEITGRNGSGKTSILDSIYWALTGLKAIQAAPIRVGENEAHIRLDLGSIKVHRRFKRTEDGEYTTSILIENEDGSRFPSPQKMLDSMLGELTLDPLEFVRKDRKKQFDALKGFVPGVDFEAIENAQTADFVARAGLNRQAKELRASAELIVIPASVPAQAIDESALIDDLKRACEHNASVERRVAELSGTVASIERFRGRATAVEAGLPDLIAKIEDSSCRTVSHLEAQIEDLQHRIAQQLDETSRKIADTRAAIKEEAMALRARADLLQKQFDSLDPIPEPIDVTAVRRSIDDARASNRLFAKTLERAGFLNLAQELEQQSRALTEAMEARVCDKQAAIAAANIPVGDLSFGDGEILLGGVPFNQASDGEQLRAAVAIAMATNPKLRVIRIRDGSLLDADAMALLAAMAEERDFQVWIERVTNGERVGFVIEEGEVRSAPISEAESEAAE